MKRRRMFAAVLLLLILVFSSGVQAQDVDLKKHPGYIDLDDIEIPEGAVDITDIDLGPALLALARLGRAEADKDLEEGLAGILSIRVKSFEIGRGEVREIRPIMERIEKKLRDEKWVSLVRIKSRDEMSNISMKFENDKVVGFLLMSLDSDDEVSFVNIFGSNIDINSIKDIGMGVSDSALDSLRMHWDWD